MSEKLPHHTDYDPDTERTRREVVHLLRSILGEVTIQAHGGRPPLLPEAHEAIRLYEDMRDRMGLRFAVSPAR